MDDKPRTVAHLQLVENDAEYRRLWKRTLQGVGDSRRFLLFAAASMVALFWTAVGFVAWMVWRAVN